MNTNSAPSVSVVVPALNEEKQIERLLESFSKQTRSDFEVIIVDNGSTDRTEDIVKSFAQDSNYNLTLLREPQKGVWYARRKGMLDAAKRGIKYIAGTDADSEVSITWIEDNLNGFIDGSPDLLTGYSIYAWSALFGKIEYADLFVKAWLARAVLQSKTHTIVRGVNFCITSKMFLEIVGEIDQPRDNNGNLAAGEDVLLGNKVEEHGGRIKVIESYVVTSPRRILYAVINKSPNNFYDLGFTEIRNEEELEEAVTGLPSEQLKYFAEESIKRRFIHVFLKGVKNGEWDDLKVFVHPMEEEFKDDLKVIDSEVLYIKYRDLFLKNIEDYGRKHDFVSSLLDKIELSI